MLYQLSYDPLWSTTYPIDTRTSDARAVMELAATNEARVYGVDTPGVEQVAASRGAIGFRHPPTPRRRPAEAPRAAVVRRRGTVWDDA